MFSTLRWNNCNDVHFSDVAVLDLIKKGLCWKMDVIGGVFPWVLRFLITAILKNTWHRLLFDFIWPTRQGCNKGFCLVLFKLLIQYLYLSIHIVNYSWYLTTSYSLLIQYHWISVLSSIYMNVKKKLRLAQNLHFTSYSNNRDISSLCFDSFNCFLFYLLH